MIRECTPDDRNALFEIINDGSQAYKGIIPDDCYHEPYMSREELNAEIAHGVCFYGWEKEGVLLAVMGIQDMGDVTLIRHAYTRTTHRGSGMGSALLAYLLDSSEKPFLVGTWSDAIWAIRFYGKHGFEQVDWETKTRLFNTYWTISPRQNETSVVLADKKWLLERPGEKE
jgi:GNAT superfamily N-acetyltransferase